VEWTVNIAVDVDSTLVMWNYKQDTGATDLTIPPFEWDWNYPLIARLVNAYFEGHTITVWSGGGADYAAGWANSLNKLVGFTLVSYSMGKQRLAPLEQFTLFIDDERVEGWLSRGEGGRGIKRYRHVLPCEEW